MSDLAAALQIAIEVHARQVDRQGEPYLFHVLRVVRAVSDEAKVVAALHDVFEDGTAGMEEAWGALSGNEQLALELLTRGYETYADYIAAIAQEAHEDRFGAIAHEVKLADLRDNLSRIPPKPPLYPLKDPSKDAAWVREWAALKRRYEKAIATLEAGS